MDRPTSFSEVKWSGQKSKGLAEQVYMFNHVWQYLTQIKWISAQLRCFGLDDMEIEECGQEIRERPRKKRATGSERTPKQISDVKAANAVSNARRALGSDRSLDQVAKVKAANTSFGKVFH